MYCLLLFVLLSDSFLPAPGPVLQGIFSASTFATTLPYVDVDGCSYSHFRTWLTNWTSNSHVTRNRAHILIPYRPTTREPEATK